MTLSFGSRKEATGLTRKSRATEVILLQHGLGFYKSQPRSTVSLYQNGVFRVLFLGHARHGVLAKVHSPQSPNITWTRALAGEQHAIPGFSLWQLQQLVIVGNVETATARFRT